MILGMGMITINKTIGETGLEKVLEIIKLKPNPLNEIAGTWPGDESIEELLEALGK